MPKIKINNITRTLLRLRGYAYGEPYEGVVECDHPHSFDLNDEGEFTEITDGDLPF